MKKEIKIGTTFSGIGSPEFALKHLYGKEYKNKVNLKWACDFEKNAKKSFLANHKPDKFYNNIYYMTHSKNQLTNEIIPSFYKSTQKKSLLKEIDLIEKEEDTFYGLENIADVDLYIFGFPCFLAGQRVKTNKGYKNIEDVKKGDKVLTHLNKYKKVTKTMEKETKKYYKVKIKGIQKKIKTTKNHPFYTFNKLKVTEDLKWVKLKNIDIEKHQLLSKENNNSNKYIIRDGIKYYIYDIEKIKEIKTKVKVYNLEVKDDNSYTIEDIIVHNCQNFSIANQKRDKYTLDDIDIENVHQHQKDLGLNATKTTLVYQSMKIIKELSKRKDPLKYFIGENVKGLIQHDQSFLWEKVNISKEELNKLNEKQKKLYKTKVKKEGCEVYKKVPGVILDGVKYKGYPSLFNKEYDGNKKYIGKTLYVIENSFKELGYKIQWKVLNANDYSFDYTKEQGGVQNRERIFIIGIKEGIDKDFSFPVPDNVLDKNKDKVSNYLNENNNKNEDLILNKKYIKEKYNKRKSGGICNQSHYLTNIKYDQGKRIYDAEGKSPCLTCVGSPKFKIKTKNGDIYREIDGKEMLSIQGFPIGNKNRGIKDKGNNFEIEEFKFVVSDNQLKKQAGNSMSVSIMYVLLRELLNEK